MSRRGTARLGRTVTAFDGTSLAARVLSSGAAPPVLVVPAPGPDAALWRPVLDALPPARGALSWDLRGFHESGPPASHALDASAHGRDAVAVLDAFGVERVHLVSWDTGARIALEVARARPERVLSQVLVCGSHGYPFGALVRRLDPAALVPVAAGIGRRFPAVVGRAIERVVTRPEIAGIVRQSGLVSADADVPALVEMLRAVASVDPSLLLATYDSLARRPAGAGLEEVAAPTLVVAGGRDALMPRVLAEEVAARLPSARLVVYERAGHFLPLEEPARLAADLEAHAARHDVPR